MTRFTVTIDLSDQEKSDITRAIVVEARLKGNQLTEQDVVDDDVRDWLKDALEFAVETRNDYLDPNPELV